MLKATNIIGMQVVSIYEGQVEGYIKNLIFSNDYKKLKSFIICDSKVEEKQYVLDAKNIHSIFDVIMIKNSSVLSPISNEIDNSPINLNAFFCSGKKLGIISDIILDEKFCVSSFATNEHNIMPNILKINKNLVIFSDENSKTKLSYCKPKNQLVTASISNSKLTTTTNININFLLGKKVIKDIFTFNNEIIIKNGSIVNDKIIQTAKLNGKLRELALSV